MTTGRAAAALIACLGALAARPASPARGASPPNAASPYDGELAEAAGRLRAEARQPQAASALAVLAGLDEQVPAKALEQAVQAGLVPRAHPLVAAQAAWLAAHLAEERGDRAAADRLSGRLGLVTEGYAIGPFGEGRASFGTVYPPEHEGWGPDLTKSHPGKGHDVRWRSVAGAVRGGEIYLDGLLRPDNAAVGYFSAFVRSDRARPAALRLGSAGPVRVWVNGVRVFERDVLRRAALDQDAAGIRLGRGWNRILVKTVVADGAWRLFLRLTEPDGRPLAGVVGAAALPRGGEVARVGSGGGAVPHVRTLAALLAERARTASPAAAARAWADLGRVLAWLTPNDRDEHGAARAFDRSLAAGPSREALIGRALAAPEEDERRRLFERAVEMPGLPPGWGAWLRLRLADLARGGRGEARAMALLREALAVDPGGWPAVVAMADAESDAGLSLAAMARLKALSDGVRRLSAVRRVWIRVADAAGLRQDGARELAALADERRADVDIQDQAARWARARGDGAEAKVRLGAAAALRPDLPALSIELARLEEGAGQTAEARARLTALAERLPDEPTVLVALGKFLHRTGNPSAGLVRLRAALALRPQDPELKRTVDRLAAAGGFDAAADELVRRFAADARTLLPPPAKASGDPPLAVDGAVVLLDRRVVRMHPSGLCRTFAQRIVQVRTARAAEEEKEFAVHYSPATEEVDIRLARVFRREADGGISILEATDRRDEDLSEPWYGLYYDSRAEIVRFDALRPGDVVEVQYLVDDVSSENQLADYFGDLRYIAETIPKRRWDYTLIAPAARPVYANEPRLPRFERHDSTEGTDRLYRFSATEVAKIEPEPAMPGLAEVAPHLHLSTYASWDEVGAAYWHLLEDPLRADEQLRATARRLVTTPRMPTAERVRAVHDFVVRSTRYVGLELGIHGYKPYNVTQVLARRFGDCKDKASLMVAMLREVGVNAELTLLRTRRGGRVDDRPASLAIFDHAIVYVPVLDRYFDGTAEFSGGDELPAEDQGVPALRVQSHGAALTETPVFSASANRVERRWLVQLAASGEDRVDEEITIRGQAAPEWREHYQTAAERSDRYGRVWSGRFPGAHLASVEMPGIDDRNAPVRVHAIVEVPHLARPGGAGTWELPVAGRDSELVRSYARLSARQHELVLAYPWQHEEELTFRLPTGWQVVSAPEPQSVEGPFGRFHLEVVAEGGVVRVRSALEVARVRVMPSDYPRFRAFLAEVDAAIAQRVLVTAGAGS